MKRFLFLYLFLPIFLVACQSKTTVPTAVSELPAQPVSSSANQAANPDWWLEGQPQVDTQGAVSVELQPLNLNNPGHTIKFSVAMNTHSVNLDMNLADLATLETDTGLRVSASEWETPTAGGHHVRGVLHFPAAVDGEPVITPETRQITITIQNVDAPERIFRWQR